MLLLVDYDNISQSERRLGLDHVLRKAVSVIDHRTLSIGSVRARLYGGWYEEGRLTKLGQVLSAELSTVSPIRYLRPDTRIPILIRAELATSILAAPRTLITNTFRKKGYPRTLCCEQRPWISCSDNANCPLGVLEGFIGNGYCYVDGCNVQPRDVLNKQEQKVVDSMIVADLIHLADEGDQGLCVISRDDDIWPGLLMASKSAHTLVHVCTQDTSRMPDYYKYIPSPPYRRVSWS